MEDFCHNLTCQLSYIYSQTLNHKLRLFMLVGGKE